MKTNIGITLDTEVLLEAKKKISNLSGTINDFLKSLLPSINEEEKHEKEEAQIAFLKASLQIAEKKLKEKEDAKVTINC